ncbi:PhoU domain protein [Candidatus Bilamarchaeum dharawalense]|uniref:PhoU domain protein n=1 Tax=Candidatus Bilamarchaeum dharawalense TaxID=2885759 RepID=A0A5E4LT09_9ARCH|nr:PhoU domain protein [Candidatus Bilamarchaeum dharawalense]
METPRKIQLTGRNTYIVSLPHGWIEKLSLGKGAPVYITDNNDGTITISPKQVKKEPKIYTISVTEGEHATMRNIVSAYIAGADKIILKGKETSTYAEKTRQLLSGVEIIAEGDGEITLSILTYEDLDIENVVKREFNVTKSMFGLVVETCKGENNCTEISKKEEEVDRLYILLLRDLVVNTIPQREAVFSAMVAKSIEKVGDHLVDICKSAKEAGRNEWLANIVLNASDVYCQAYEAFTKKELDSSKFKIAIAKYKESYQKADSTLKKQKDISKTFLLLMLLEKCNKIVRYSEDIMESNTDIIFARMETQEKG